jgi:hypothetical protein
MPLVTRPPPGVFPIMHMSTITASKNSITSADMACSFLIPDA